MARSLLIAAVVCLTATGMASAVEPWVAADNFESYTPGSDLSGQGGWTDTGGGTAYKIVPAPGGVGGTQGITTGSNSTQINWTSHPWNWADLSVNDRVIARMDFQANGSGQFDDDRVGWVVASNQTSSSYHFGTQLDMPDGGLAQVEHFRGKNGLGDSARAVFV